ncbi:type II toxin-antitoxin system VapC family toxin [[Phormidium] sp. ETS-05]|uniref:type II toxin-antitoxin system VapC family toxin n=1 Tax=[Phormidium] sp. ETS-05 TaxID=222819 RepID=UPI0031FE7D4E
MRETVYIETSIIGYLTARSSKNLIIAANIEITRDWWENCHHNFNLYISQIVVDEISRGDIEMVNQRLEVIRDYPLLEVTEAVDDLASEFMAKTNLPPKAADDAIHIAVATVNNLDYLLTWNCQHIANAQIQKNLGKYALT